MGKQYQELTIAEVAEGMLACRANASELLLEASVLEAGGHAARAYALSHAACEELAKYSILELAGRRLSLGHRLHWNELWKRFRSHESKQAQLNVQLIYLIFGSANSLTPDLLGAMEVLFDYGLSTRNAALYVDVGPDGKFRKPSDIDFQIPLPILRQIASLMLVQFQQHGATSEEIASELQTPLKEEAQVKALALLSVAVQRLKSAGYSKADVHKVLAKAKS